MPPGPCPGAGFAPQERSTWFTTLDAAPAKRTLPHEGFALNPRWSRLRALAGHWLAGRAQRPRQRCQDSHAAQPKATKAMPVTIAMAFKAQLSGVTPRAIRGVMKVSGLIAK